jgi:hypothetical protein
MARSGREVRPAKQGAMCWTRANYRHLDLALMIFHVATTPLTLVCPTLITNFTMAPSSASVFHPRSRPNPFIPLLPKPSLFWSFMVFTALSTLQDLHIFLGHSAHFYLQPELIMPRQRGRPQRGSPWHPPRPRTPASHPVSPSTFSSLPLQPELEPLTSSTPPASRFECLVLTDSSPSSLS